MKITRNPTIYNLILDVDELNTITTALKYFLSKIDPESSYKEKITVGRAMEIFNYMTQNDIPIKINS